MSAELRSGPDHGREALRLEALAVRAWQDLDPDTAALRLGQAQVHATLALTQAMIGATPGALGALARDEWTEELSRRRRAGRRDEPPPAAAHEPQVSPIGGGFGWSCVCGRGQPGPMAEAEASRAATRHRRNPDWPPPLPAAPVSAASGKVV